jgi:hypothetical protein
MPAFLAVLWSIVFAFALSFLCPETYLTSLSAILAGLALAAALVVLGQRLSIVCYWGMLLALGIAAAGRGASIGDRCAYGSQTV